MRSAVTPAPRLPRALLPACGTRPARLARWISCSERTSPSPAEAIARAAAIPPAIVVMHGTPRAIAARRIS